MSQVDDRPPSRGEEIANEIVVAFPADDTAHILAASAIVASRMLAVYGAPLPVTLKVWRALSKQVEIQIAFALADNER